MVAAMYDASLDQFASNNWGFAMYPYYGYAAFSWQPVQFYQTNAYFRYSNWNETYQHPGERFYPYLNWFGVFYDHRTTFAGGRNKAMTMRSQAAPVEFSNMAVAGRGRCCYGSGFYGSSSYY